MKTLLIFPPQWIPYRPYLSLPSLAAYLRQNGIDVEQRDFNIEAFDLMLSKDYLLGLESRLKAQFIRLENQDRLQAGIEQSHYNDLFMALANLQRTTRCIDAAKKTYRGQDYYCPNKLVSARRTVKEALAIISTAYFPNRIDFSSFELLDFRGTFQEIEALSELDPEPAA